MDLRIATNLTAEDFAASRFELPDDGRWTELVTGRVLIHSPPPPEHGTVVLNFSKALARYLERHPEGYASFEQGLIVARQPDSAYFPAVSYFAGGPRFAELDNLLTETRPVLVLELASTPDRRRVMRQRVSEYLQWGVSVVLVIDPKEQRGVVHLPSNIALPLKHDDVLEATSQWWHARPELEFLKGFRLSLNELFQEPSWAKR